MTVRGMKGALVALGLVLALAACVPTSESPAFGLYIQRVGSGLVQVTTVGTANTANAPVTLSVLGTSLEVVEPLPEQVSVISVESDGVSLNLGTIKAGAVVVVQFRGETGTVSAFAEVACGSPLGCTVRAKPPN